MESPSCASSCSRSRRRKRARRRTERRTRMETDRKKTALLSDDLFVVVSFPLGSHRAYLCVVSLSKYSSTYSLSLHTPLIVYVVHLEKETNPAPPAFQTGEHST